MDCPIYIYINIFLFAINSTNAHKEHDSQTIKLTSSSLKKNSNNILCFLVLQYRETTDKRVTFSWSEFNISNQFRYRKYTKCHLIYTRFCLFFCFFFILFFTILQNIKQKCNY